MKRWMKMAAMLFAVSMMACGCSNSAAPAETSAPTEAAETEAETAAETAEAEAGAEEGTGEVPDVTGIEVDLSAGLDDEGNILDMNTADFVTLPDYKNMEVAKDDVTPSAAEIQDAVDNLMAGFAEEVQITDREIAEGDIVNIDYVGSVDGVEFEGGSTGGAGTNVTAGSSDYIDDFLTQIIGHKAGETINVEVTFPDPYQGNPDLSGKDAVFVTTINYISESVTPELTDDFVVENFAEEYKISTVDELNAKMETNLTLSKQNDTVWNWLKENCTFQKDPEELAELLLQEYVDSVVLSAAQYGMPLEDMLSYYGMATEDDLRDYYRYSAIDLAKQYTIAQAICDAEGMVADQDAMEAYFEGSDYTNIVDYYGIGYVKMQVKYKLVSDKLMEYATVK